MTFSIDNGLSYEKALALIKEAQAVGIEGAIEPGGMSFSIAGDDEREILDAICQKYGVRAHQGMTRHQSDVIYRVSEDSDDLEER